MVREYKRILYVYYQTMFQLHVCNSEILNTLLQKQIVFKNK